MGYIVNPNTNSIYNLSVGLEWTTELPTQEGWYWVMDKEKGLDMAFVKRVTTHFEIWIDGEYRNDFEFYTHWLGPLPEPEKTT